MIRTKKTIDLEEWSSVGKKSKLSYDLDFLSLVLNARLASEVTYAADNNLKRSWLLKAAGERNPPLAERK